MREPSRWSPNGDKWEELRLRRELEGYRNFHDEVMWLVEHAAPEAWAKGLKEDAEYKQREEASNRPASNYGFCYYVAKAMTLQKRRPDFPDLLMFRLFRPTPHGGDSGPI